MNTSLLATLNERFAEAIAQVCETTPERVTAAVQPSADPKFGDYQCNAAMALARQLRQKPRDVAQRIIDAVHLDDLADPLEIAGPGFINVRLTERALAGALEAIPVPTEGDRDPTADASTRFAPADRLAIPRVADPATVLVDYSSPNIAKQMHVGHLRSTIIGDVFARVLEFEGHRVIRQNHLGDWGTAIGAVITGLWYVRTRLARGEDLGGIRKRLELINALRGQGVDERRNALAPIAAEWTEDLARNDAADYAESTTLDELELGYVFVQTIASIASGTGVLVGSGAQEQLLEGIPRLITTFLQRGSADDRYEQEEWRQARTISVNACQSIYDVLGVTLTPDDMFGESDYNAFLAETVTDLKQRLAQPTGPDDAIRAVYRNDQGADCIFLEKPDGTPAFKNPEGNPLPMIIRKSDGAYLYSTTDLAAIRYRVNTLGAERIIYVVGAPQKLHFQMLFAAARAAGLAPSTTRLEHVSFGSVLGDNRKPLRTREGGTVKLLELLDEAQRRAFEVLQTREAEEDARDADGALDDASKRKIAQRVGIAAVKYFDLSRDRNNDYVFNWDQMLTFQGNTAPYMMYAYARIRSIYRKAGDPAPQALYADGATITLGEPAERALALRLLRFRESIRVVASDLLPHALCSYLYELAADFMRFYDSCPVLQAPDDATRNSRLRLCDLTARTLKLGLNLLGIDVIERM